MQQPNFDKAVEWFFRILSFAAAGFSFLAFNLNSDLIQAKADIQQLVREHERDMKYLDKEIEAAKITAEKTAANTLSIVKYGEKIDDIQKDIQELRALLMSTLRLRR
jgi:hypothetical protein